MDIWYYLMTPFTWLLKTFYGIFGNSYGLAIILFALVVKLVTFPLSLKGKRGMIQMNMLNGEMQKLQKRYAKDQQRYQLEVQKLYEKEGVNPMGGCLWSMFPLLILFPVYAVVRRPMKYWLGLTDKVIEAVTAAITGAGITLNRGYPEISMVSHFFQDPASLTTAQAAAGEAASSLYGINFNFLGIDLSATPDWRLWEVGFSWATVGLLLIPVLTAVTAFLSSKIMMQTNQINQNGEDNPAAKQSKMMLWMSPLMMLYFSFVMPGAMGVYIIANSVFSVVQEIICGKMLKKDYEQAAEAARLREIEEKEEEKRLRREKAEQRAREAEEARKNKGKKKEKDPDDDKSTAQQKAASRVGMRQYARGRAYEPDRFGGVTPYHEDLAAGTAIPETPAPAEEEPQESGAALPQEPEVVTEAALEADLEQVNAQLDAAIEETPDGEPKED